MIQTALNDKALKAIGYKSLGVFEIYGEKIRLLRDREDYDKLIYNSLTPSGDIIGVYKTKE